MQKTFVTCGIIVGALIVLVIAVVIIGGAYLSRPLPPIVIPPPPPLPADNGFDDCVRAASLLKDTDKLDRLDVAKQPRQAAALVKLNRPSLDLVREALPKDYMTPQVKRWDEEFRYLKGYRDIGKLLLMEGRLKASGGDLSGAVESFLDARRFGALMPSGGSVIHMLVGRAVSETGFRGLESIYPKLDSSECRYVLKELGKADAREPLLHQTLEWDKAMGLAFIKELQEGTIKDDSGKPMGEPFPPLIDRLFGRGRSSREDYESYMQALGDELSKPFYLRKPPPEPQTIGSAFATPSFDLITRTSLTSTKEQILKLMIALRSYELERGAYPDSLAGLKSYGIDTTDEFTGKPLKYKRAGNGYLLYSVGPDGKDNGGAPPRNINGKDDSGAPPRNINDKDVGDIVAGKLFPPKK